MSSSLLDVKDRRSYEHARQKHLHPSDRHHYNNPSRKHLRNTRKSYLVPPHRLDQPFRWTGRIARDETIDKHHWIVGEDAASALDAEEDEYVPEVEMSKTAELVVEDQDEDVSARAVVELSLDDLIRPPRKRNGSSRRSY